MYVYGCMCLWLDGLEAGSGRPKEAKGQRDEDGERLGLGLAPGARRRGETDWGGSVSFFLDKTDDTMKEATRRLIPIANVDRRWIMCRTGLAGPLVYASLDTEDAVNAPRHSSVG